MNIFQLMFWSAAAVCAVSCTSAKHASNEQAAQIGGEWNIVKAGGETVTDMETPPFISFDLQEKRVSGNGGCNMLTCSFSIEGENGLSFGRIATTRMACPDLEAESKVVESLSKTASFDFSDSSTQRERLLLKDESGNVVVELSRRSEVDGKWNVVEVQGRGIGNTENNLFLTFSSCDGRVFGNIGCNIYNSSFEVDERQKALLFGEGLLTQMLCPDMEIEDTVKGLLPKVRKYVKNDEEKLKLCDGDGNVLMLLSR